MIDLAFVRASAYLAAAGAPPTRENTLRLLRLLEEAIDRSDRLGWVIGELPARFGLPAPQVPPAMPPIRRGSIGYDSYRRGDKAARP